MEESGSEGVRVSIRPEFGFPFLLASESHVGEINSGLFSFLSYARFYFPGPVASLMDKIQRCKGTLLGIFLFLEIEIGEVLFVSLPEEIVESID